MSKKNKNLATLRYWLAFSILAIALCLAISSCQAIKGWLSPKPSGVIAHKSYPINVLQYDTVVNVKASIEEIAYNMGFIDADQLRKIAEPLLKSGYGEYLLKIIDLKH